MVFNKSRQILVVTILLVFLAGFACYCMMGESNGRPPGFLIWIEENLFGYYRPERDPLIIIEIPEGP